MDRGRKSRTGKDGRGNLAARAGLARDALAMHTASFGRIRNVSTSASP